jgi:hypothetical protein
VNVRLIERVCFASNRKRREGQGQKGNALVYLCVPLSPVVLFALPLGQLGQSDPQSQGEGNAFCRMQLMR